MESFQIFSLLSSLQSFFPLSSLSDKNVKIFFIYEDTSLRLAILMYYDILRNISQPVIFKTFNIFWVIGGIIVPKSGDRKKL